MVAVLALYRAAYTGGRPRRGSVLGGVRYASYTGLILSHLMVGAAIDMRLLLLTGPRAWGASYKEWCEALYWGGLCE